MNTQAWKIEASYTVDHPREVEVQDLPELRSWVQSRADAKKVRVDRPPIGKLHFRYEHDADDQPIVVHVYFNDRHGARKRFMRLRKIEG